VGGCQARSMFLKLIQKVSELHILNEKHVRVYLDVNPKEVEPLLIEIFDLKSR
jgi:nuclear receptor subfamily 1 group I